MPADDLKELVRRRPFEPFTLYLTDGASFEVRHPEMILVAKRTVTVGIPSEPPAPGAVPEIDRVATVNILHIVRIEPLPAEGSSPTGNGQA